jgi:proteic killer suppression protein
LLLIVIPNSGLDFADGARFAAAPRGSKLLLLFLFGLFSIFLSALSASALNTPQHFAANAPRAKLLEDALKREFKTRASEINNRTPDPEASGSNGAPLKSNLRSKAAPTPRDAQHKISLTPREMFVTLWVTIERKKWLPAGERMDISFRDNDLRAACEDEAVCKREHGAAMAKKITLRLAALRAANSLGTFWPPNSGPERCHELKGDLEGRFSVDLKQPYRLLFTVRETAPPSDRSNEQFRWNSITAIHILEIEDTHG